MTLPRLPRRRGLSPSFVAALARACASQAHLARLAPLARATHATPQEPNNIRIRLGIPGAVSREGSWGLRLASGGLRRGHGEVLGLRCAGFSPEMRLPGGGCEVSRRLAPQGFVSVNAASAHAAPHEEWVGGSFVQLCNGSVQRSHPIRSDAGAEAPSDLDQGSVGMDKARGFVRWVGKNGNPISHREVRP